MQFQILWDKWKNPIKKKPQQVPAIVSPFGIYPIGDSNDPEKVYHLYMCHSTCSLTQRVVEEIEKLPGVETLEIHSRYRFRVGIGLAFVKQAGTLDEVDSSLEVRELIKDVLKHHFDIQEKKRIQNGEQKDSQPEDVIVPGLEFVNETQLNDDIQQRINEYIADFKFREKKYWLILVLPNLEIVHYSTDSKRNFNTKLKVYQEITEMLSCKLFSSEDNATKTIKK